MGRGRSSFRVRIQRTASRARSRPLASIRPPSAVGWLESAAAKLASRFTPQRSDDDPAAAEDADPAFTAYLRSTLGVAAQPTVLVDRPGAGRGLVAAQRIARGQLAAFVPASSVVTAAVASRESPLLRSRGGGGGGLTHDLPDWTALAVWLMEQRHALDEQQQQQDQQGSRWAPYVERLPREGAMGTVLEWHPLEEGDAAAALRRREALLAEDLAGSGLRHKAAEILAAADATWREVVSAAEAMEGGSSSSTAPYTRARLEWALSVLLSRVVRLDSAPGEPSSLVPWCDFCNHSPQAACYLDLQEQQQGGGGIAAATSSSFSATAVVGVRADRAYAPGEEVFISYGPKSSGELLLSYGFCPPPQSNADNDRAFVQVAVAGATADAAAKRRALARRGIPAVETFALRADALPEGMLQYVAFADAELSEEEGGEGGEGGDADRAAEALAAVVFDRDGSSALPPELERVAWRGVAARCRQALGEYTATEEQDRALASPEASPWLRASGAFAGDAKQRRAALAEVRLRERRILGAAMFAATSQAKRRRGA